MSDTNPEISVVAPLHNEEGNVRPLFEAIRSALGPLGRSFEVLLVNDGSTDATASLLDALAAEDRRLRPVHLDGNFGEAAALCAGFEAARGRIILTLDGDLQNDPAELPRLLALLEEGGYRAVSGWRRQRQEDFSRRILPSRVANWLIARVTGVPSRDNGCGLKAYRAEVVKGTYLPHGLHRFMPAVFGVTAPQFAQIEVTDRARTSGRSHYGMSRLFAVLRDMLVIRHVVKDADRALARANVLLVVDGAVLAGAAWTATHTPDLRVFAAGTLALGLLAYLQCVRTNLVRWQTAQREKTFRIRRVGLEEAPDVQAARRPTEALPPQGRVRA